MARRSLALVSLAVALGSVALAAGVHADENHAADGARGRAREPEPQGFTYVVRSGDTASEIALRFGVTLEALLAANPGMDADRIRAGQELRIVNGLRRVVHTVRRGESLSRIAAQYEVRVDDLLRWNAGLSRDRLHAGRELVIYTAIPESRSQSIGTPHRGRLVDGRMLPTRHPAFFVRTPSRAYGTDETVRYIVEAFEALRAADPEAPRIEVHDLSLRGGGPMNGHHSHASGRDADLAYFQRDCRDLCRFRRIGPDQLDARRQWALFEHWIERGVVELIVVDHALQRPLYEEARARGASRAELSRWFQYPRPIEDRYGLIRHHPRHADHFHVRFVCHESDEECR
ncbi:MAG TPA: penicillin-insensitive murein endopeptidase [Sandaracinaceae bacterium]